MRTHTEWRDHIHAHVLMEDEELQNENRDETAEFIRNLGNDLFRIMSALFEASLEVFDGDLQTWWKRDNGTYAGVPFHLATAAIQVYNVLGEYDIEIDETESWFRDRPKVETVDELVMSVGVGLHSCYREALKEGTVTGTAGQDIVMGLLLIHDFAKSAWINLPHMLEVRMELYLKAEKTT